jgi:hypothetical protein
MNVQLIPCDYNYAKRSMKMTYRWLTRRVNHPKSRSAVCLTAFPIVCWCRYKDQRNGAPNPAFASTSGEPAVRMLGDRGCQETRGQTILMGKQY